MGSSLFHVVCLQAIFGIRKIELGKFLIDKLCLSHFCAKENLPKSDICLLLAVRFSRQA